MRALTLGLTVLGVAGSVEPSAAFEYLGHQYLTYSNFIPERIPAMSFAETGTISPPPPPITYTFRFTSSVSVLSAKVGEYGYYNAQYYQVGPDGTLQNYGGFDSWDPQIGPGSQCIDVGYCRSISFSGNSVIFSITDAPTHTLDEIYGGVSEAVTWLRAEDFTVEIPDGATGRFTFERLMNGVPEPDTWAMLLIGFGFIGTSLRWRGRDSGHNETA